jgi:hypothetical protein
MFETVEANRETLAQVKDLIYNVRMEAKEIQPLREGVEKLRVELAGLKREVKEIDEKIKFPNICPACGKPLLPEFNMCPYCGENIKIKSSPVLNLKNYK